MSELDRLKSIFPFVYLSISPSTNNLFDVLCFSLFSISVPFNIDYKPIIMNVDVLTIFFLKCKGRFIQFLIMDHGLHTRRALECYILMYGCKAWTFSKKFKKKLEASEMGFLRRMLQISWTAKKSRKTVLREVDTRSLTNRIHKCQATFFGHVMRREKLEHLATTGMIAARESSVKRCWMDKQSDQK